MPRTIQSDLQEIDGVTFRLVVTHEDEIECPDTRVDTDSPAGDYPMFASEKIDGLQGRIRPHERPCSRNDVAFRNPHLAGHLSELQSLADETGLTFIGELRSDSLGPFGTSGRLVHSDKPLPADLRFYLFDIRGPHRAFRETADLLDRFPACENVVVLRQIPVDNEAEARDLMDRVVAAGGEGVVLRHPGDIDREPIRLKPTITLDGQIVALHRGRGRLADTLGAVEVLLPDGRFCRVGSGFSDAQRRDLWQRGAASFGTWIEFAAARSPDTRKPREPRFVRFRHADSGGKV